MITGGRGGGFNIYVSAYVLRRANGSSAGGARVVGGVPRVVARRKALRRAR